VVIIGCLPPACRRCGTDLQDVPALGVQKLQVHEAAPPPPPTAKAPLPKSSANPDAQSEIEALKKWIAQLESERAASNSRLASLPQLRTPSAIAPAATLADRENRDKSDGP